eukprot:CAMPEP_0184674532 /NCGR_PEP_ID=MMETSP0308-20130426/87291_1 /TAXON_ID=38269 /ORGANISM="Gloeochaete witrockiana, Strain SAG 46.84" /LENGTH=1040 /DNA_ID=CAMNT_0027122145 /DNA_START=77 /DNA_END=3196 /DNA_ORIENTATION=+
MPSLIRIIALTLAVYVLVIDARVHSLNAEFPSHNATSGVWQLGYIDFDYTFHLYEQANADPACGTGFTKFDRGGGGEFDDNDNTYPPFIMGCRISGQCFCGVSNTAGDIFMNPRSRLFPVVRFTAPSTGYYTFNATLEGRNSTAWVVLVSNSSNTLVAVFQQQFQPIEYDRIDARETVPLYANDFMDLLVIGGESSSGTNTVLSILEVPSALPSRTPSSAPTPTPDYCQPTRQINATVGGVRIRSSGGATYGSGLSCEWILRAPANHYLRIAFESFSTGSTYDYVSVYDSLMSTANPIAAISGFPSPLPVYSLGGVGRDSLMSTANPIAAIYGFPSPLPVYNLGGVGRVTFSSYYEGYGGFVALVTAVRGSRPSPTRTPTPTASPTRAMICEGQSDINATTGGTFFTSNTAEEYEDNMDCSWVISAPANHFIRIVFSSFETEQGYDYVNVYDGTDGVEPVLSLSGRIDQPYPSADVQSPSVVTFTSDGSALRSGFTAYAYAVSGALPSPTPSSTPSATPDYCRPTRQINATVGGVRIRSNGGATYGSGLSCEWILRAPANHYLRIAFESFSTGSTYDYVSVYDSLMSTANPIAAISGFPSPLPVYSLGGVGRVTFSSYYEGYTGFVALVTAVRGSRPSPTASPTTAMICDGQSNILATTDGAFFTSNTAGVYEDGMDCSWVISAPANHYIHIEFNSFETEQGYDYVKVYDGTDGVEPVLRLSGRLEPPYPSANVQSPSVVTFTSDGSAVRSGFTAYAYAVRGAIPSPTHSPTSTPSPTIRTLCEESQDVNLVAGRPMVIASSTSGPYGNNMICRWDIRAPALYDIRINFTAFDTEDGNDYVSVTDEVDSQTTYFTGRPRPLPAVRISDYATVQFFTDGAVTGAGFRAVITAVRSGFRPTPTPGSFCGGTDVRLLPSTANSGITVYSNQPDSRSSPLDCGWIFIAPEGYSIKINFTSFDTYEFDYVRVYQGVNRYSPYVARLSGRPSQLPVLIVRGSVAFMTYAAQELGDGFYASVSAFRPANPTPRARTRTPTRKFTSRW